MKQSELKIKLKLFNTRIVERIRSSRIDFLGGEDQDRRRIGLAEGIVGGQGRALLLGVGWPGISLFVVATPHKIYKSFPMSEYSNINEGIYLVQSGFRNNTAIIECPYISHKIEVYNSQGLKILHGASVYWTEVRRQYLSKKKGNREVINAVVVGIKHCHYLCDAKNILCTLRINREGQTWKIQGVPVNKKLPIFDVIDSPEIESLDFSKSDILEQYRHRYMWAQLLAWNYEDEIPKGCITGTFQNQYKTPEVEGDVLLHCLQISQKKSTLLYPRHVNKKVQYLPIKNHQEFNSMVFTIDPHNAVDIEDGLSLEPLGHGLYQLGVHISDVTSFHNLINRQEVAAKGCSTYLPHKTIHMMPPELIELMALKSKRRRLAFSVFFKVDEQGTILESSFKKTIVRSCAQLSYEEAQNIMDDRLDQDNFMREKQLTFDEVQEMREKLLLLKKIAMNRRSQRSSCEMFDKSEVVFQLDERGLPINIGLKKRIESEKLVEEFMIMTNCEVAKKLVNDFGSNSLIIYHPKPLDSNIQHLNGYLSDLGVRFRADNIMHLQKQFKKLFEKEEFDEKLKELLLYKAMHIQEYAVYTRHLNIYKGHFGLSLDFYTHFTSPVRRFADQIVHEQLEKCINNQVLKPKDIAQLEEEIELMNRARARNKKLKQFVVECFMNMYLYHSKEKISTKGFIIRLGLRSATIYVPQYNLIKDVTWNGSASYADKDKIQLVMREGSRKIVKEFQKNDSLNIQIECQIHQEIQLSIVIEHNGELVKI